MTEVRFYGNSYAIWHIWVLYDTLGYRKQEKSEPASGILVTYHIFKQRRLRQVCTYVQTDQSFPCLHTQSMDVDENSDQHLKEAFVHNCDKFKNLMCWPKYN